jgi:hypothetical protein
MNNLPSLTLGHTYHTNTGTRVTPVKVLPNQKAIFVTDEFYPTPFVVWSYSLSPTDPTVISLYSGSYYMTLDQAIDAESDKPGPMRLILSFYCPDCETMYHHEVTATSVQELCEQIEDIRVHCPDCGYMWMGVHALSIKDDDTEYEIPLWHGPVAGSYNIK